MPPNLLCVSDTLLWTIVIGHVLAIIILYFGLINKNIDHYRDFFLKEILSPQVFVPTGQRLSSTHFSCHHFYLLVTQTFLVCWFGEGPELTS